MSTKIVKEKIFKKNEKEGLTFGGDMTIITLVRDARVVELADSLDSGSSVHYARAGSSPASRTNRKTLEAARLRGFFLFLEAVLALLVNRRKPCAADAR